MGGAGNGHQGNSYGGEDLRGVHLQFLQFSSVLTLDDVEPVLGGSPSLFWGAATSLGALFTQIGLGAGL